MIRFFATSRHFQSFKGFFDEWAPELRSQIRYVSYERLSLFRALPPGATVFTDLERLLPWEFTFVRHLARTLDAYPGHYRVLNHPDRYQRRFDYLRLLADHGLNDFRVYRLDEARGRVKFPAFLRNELDHDGSIGGLLRSQEELDRVAATLPLRKRFQFKNLMVVEYCDCSDVNGLFRKYSAMNVGGTIVPRHVLFSREWLIKHPDLVEDAMVKEEREFIEQFPHRDAVREAFRLAGVDYGRIDYGVRNGRIQVWEINTNPVIVPRPKNVNPLRLPAQSESARGIIEALRVLAAIGTNPAAFPFRSARMVLWKPVQFLGVLYQPFRR